MRPLREKASAPVRAHRCGRDLVLRHGHVHVDVAARGLGVGAGLVGGVGKRLRGFLVRAGDGDLKLHADEEALGAVVEGHACADGGVGDVRALVLGHHLEGGVEASGVAGGEELLRVGTLTAAAQLLRGGHGEVQVRVLDGGAAIAAGAGGECFGGVYSGHDESFRAREFAPMIVRCKSEILKSRQSRARAGRPTLRGRRWWSAG